MKIDTRRRASTVGVEKLKSTFNAQHSEKPKSHVFQQQKHWQNHKDELKCASLRIRNANVPVFLPWVKTAARARFLF